MQKIIITHPNFSYLKNNSDNLFLDMSFNKFPDSWPNFFIEEVEKNIKHKEVVYIGDFSTPEKLFENYVIIKGILDYGVSKLDIYMPFFPVGTFERIDKKGEIPTAKYFADIFSNLPSGINAKTSIYIYDIHALGIRFYFDTTKINLETLSAMDLIKQKIDKNTVICFPDDGAYKRFFTDFKDYENIICIKKRDGNKREVVIKEGDPKGKEILIVDDLIQTGGTIIETAKMLKKQGAKKVLAFATHGVFPNNSHINLASNLDKLYVTDSIPKNINRSKDVGHLEVLSLFTNI